MTEYFCMLFMETVLKVGLGIFFSNIQYWKGIQEKAGEVNSTYPYTGCPT
jgi:hypothetical protein